MADRSASFASSNALPPAGRQPHSQAILQWSAFQYCNKARLSRTAEFLTLSGHAGIQATIRQPYAYTGVAMLQPAESADSRRLMILNVIRREIDNTEEVE